MRVEQPRKTADKYQAILDAAVRVIAESGYHHAQVSRIAREAGVAEGTIYLYFKNKEDVLVSLFREKMGEFITLVRRELGQWTDPLAKLRGLVATHYRYLESDRSLALVTQIQLRQPNSSIREAITGPLKEYFRLIEELVAEGMASGDFRPHIDVKIARNMIFGTMDEVATCWVLSRRQYSLTDQVEKVWQLLAGGLSRNPGQAV